jgi:type IV pilus assembly protein PilV
MRDTTQNQALPTRMSGFTVIEVLVSLSILAVAILGIAVSATSIMRANQTSHFTTIASDLAQDKLEEITANPSTIASGGPITDVVDGVTFTRSWTVTSNTPISGMKQIVVTVSWTDYIAKTITVSSAING